MLAVAINLAIAGFVLPIAPIGSEWFKKAVAINGDLAEEIGWSELVKEVARIRDTVPPEKRERMGILTGNYGEAGAVDTDQEYRKKRNGSRLKA